MKHPWVNESDLISDGLYGEHVFNPGLIRWRGRLGMVYSIGPCSPLQYVTLDEDFKPLPHTNKQIDLPQPYGGVHDARLFTLEGRLCMSVQVLRAYRDIKTGMAVLDDDFNIISYQELGCPSPQPFEKNWIFFSDHYCTYWLRFGKHDVYRLVGNRIEPVYRTTYRDVWTQRWGEARGGTNVVLHDGLYWAFHHSVAEVPKGYCYSMGAYAFDPKPPFRIRYMTRRPLYRPDKCVLLFGAMKAVIFPSGAIYEDGWTVLAGYNDQRIKVFRFQHEDLMQHMVKV